jgi:AcrR family transcriptional regulator
MTAEPADVATTPKRRRRVHRATSEELVQAALRVIARDGVAAATTRKIAEEAAVPLGAVHYWFTDKNALFEEVVREVVGRLEKAAAPADPARGASVEDVRGGLHAAWDEIVADDPGAQLGLYELTTMALRTPSMRHLARLQYTSYRETVARTIAPVAAGLDEQRAATIAELIAVAFDGLCLAWLADPEGSHPADVLDLLADLLGPALPQRHAPQ